MRKNILFTITTMLFLFSSLLFAQKSSMVKVEGGTFKKGSV